MKYFTGYTEWNDVDISELNGQTIKAIRLNGDEDELEIETTDNLYLMFHRQDCCESVTLEDYDIEDLHSLEGQKVISASKESNSGDASDGYSTETWTFYKILCERDSVTMRWYGTSNGYYSEDVDFMKEIKEG